MAALARGVTAVGSSPVVLAVCFLSILAAWLGLVALGMEGAPGRLVDLFAIPPISTYYDLGNGVGLYGLGRGLLLFLLASIVVRALVTAPLTGLIVEAIEGGGPVREGLRRGMRAFPTILAVNMISFALIVTGNVILPFLGPGLGFLGFMAVLVGGLFFLVFAPISAIREGRGVQESFRRSGRAALLMGSRNMLMATFYFLLALPVMIGVAPSGNRLTANPSLGTWVFVLLSNFVHLVFVAAFAYRWIQVEADVPEHPIRRRRR